MKTYRAGWKKYQDFSASFALSPKPITLEKVTLFIAYAGTQGLAASTIEVYLAGLRFFRLLDDPTCSAPTFHTPYTNLITRGIRRVNAARMPSQIRLPITTGMMLKIKASLAREPHSFENMLVWAAACTGFFGFLRCSEFLAPDNAPFDPRVHLCVADLHYIRSDSQHHMEVRIKASKVDQFRVGTTIALGATSEELCPVAAILDFLAARWNTPGALFINSDGTPMRRRQFVSKIQHALHLAGVNERHFNGHSFRIGAATSASQAGVPETTIKLLGRWSSMAYQQYIRPSTPELAAVSKRIAGLKAQQTQRKA